MDTGTDYDLAEKENQGWGTRSDLIDASYVVNLVAELPLDLSSSFKGIRKCYR
ncbi:MAG: hypothetical protein GY737_17130 [Desulfobacteraceae bacterium]|nr:hypothetical protein [Desulfobacteraceae bacterium]